MDQSTIAPALEELRALVTPDGGDVVLEGVDGATVRLRLVLEQAHCVECVMPRPFLEQIALDLFQAGGTGADAIVIDDPREAPGFVAPEQ